MSIMYKVCKRTIERVNYPEDIEWLDSTIK